MPKVHIYREIADEVVMTEAMRRITLAANVLASKIESNLQAIISRRGSKDYTRPVYASGKHAGKWWTARDAGELLKSVRVVKKEEIDPKDRNIWVIVGNSKAYWAAIYEYATDPKKGGKFYRPALASARPIMKSVIENG